MATEAFSADVSSLSALIAEGKMVFLEWTATAPRVIVQDIGHARSFFGEVPAPMDTLDFLRAYVHPEDQTEAQGAVRRIQETSSSGRFLLRFWSSAAEQWRWMRAIGHCHQAREGHVLIMLEDIHDFYPGKSAALAQPAGAHTPMPLDDIPVACCIMDHHMRIIDCNALAPPMFGYLDKNELMHHSTALFASNYDDSRYNIMRFIGKVRSAFETGSERFEWMNMRKDGVILPVELTLIRVPWGRHHVIAVYFRDLRESQAFAREADLANLRRKVMLDSMPLSCNIWNARFENVDCNTATLKLFGIPSKREYIEHQRIFSFSPERQPDGRRSDEACRAALRECLETGHMRLEWVHRSAQDEHIPSEVTLERVQWDEGYVVVSYIRDLREEKAMLAEIDEANFRRQVMLDATPLCCNYWDENYHNIDCNAEAPRLFDLGSKQEYLDHFAELSPKYQPGGGLSAELAIIHINNAFKNGLEKFEWVHKKLTGELIPSEITLVRVELGDRRIVAGYTRDLRETKALQAETQEAHERRQIMLDSTPLCCGIWDEGLHLIDCNAAAPKLFGLPRKQNYIDRFDELSPERQPDGAFSRTLTLERMQQVLDSGMATTFEWMHQTLDGEEIPAEVTLMRARWGSRYILAGYTRDLREEKAMLAEIHKTEDQLRLARDQAEESARAKSEFLANMSHEIRTPMNAINGMTYLLMRTRTSPQQQNYIDKIQQSSRLLLRIINEILDFSKIEAGRLEMENIAFDLERIVYDANDVISEGLAEKHLDMRIHIDPDIPHALVGDPLRLRQILINLLSNAVKFTAEGFVRISVDMQEQDDKQALVRFLVQDSGIGMDEAQVNRVFSPFIQADTSTTRKYGGTGLGLAITRRLVEYMGGEIWCESAPGEGSSFYFTARFGQSADGAAADGTPIRYRFPVVLLGDDDAALETLRSHLRVLNLPVTATYADADSLSLADPAGGEDARLIIMAWNDVGEKAPPALRGIQQRYAGALPGVLIVLPDSEEADAFENPDYAAAGYIALPLELSSLYNAVLERVHRMEQSAAAEPEQSRENPLAGLRILLAEDNEINQLLACELLRLDGYVVDVAGNGREALDMLEKNEYALVLMDIQMPDMDGLEAARRIRENPRYDDLPILAMTAHAMAGDREKSLQAGMNDHVTKPIDPDLLAKALRKWINK